MSLNYKDVRIRPVEAADLPLLQILHNDPSSTDLTVGWELPVSMDKQLEWFSNLKKENTKFRGMVELKTGEVIGTASVANMDYLNRTISLNGVKILPQYQGSGYAQQALIAMISLAFDDLGFYIMEVVHLETQKITRHVLEKMGFVREGTLRKRVYKNSQRIDVFVWSITAAEYREYLPRWNRNEH